MNDKDKQAFDTWRDTPKVVDIYDAWEAACKYKNYEIETLRNINNVQSSIIDSIGKELTEWKEAARSEAQMLNEERERSKILVEALEGFRKSLESDWNDVAVHEIDEVLAKYKEE